MICQYCGSALNTGGTCLNPACPGRLRREGEALSVAPTEPEYFSVVPIQQDLNEPIFINRACPLNCPGNISTLAPVAPVSKMVRIDQGLPTNYCSFCGHSYEDDGMKCYMGPDVSICSDCLDALNGQLVPLDAPAPAEVERLVEELLDYHECLLTSTRQNNELQAREDLKLVNDLKSRLLAALTNTIPYLSGDVNVGGCSGIILKQK